MAEINKNCKIDNNSDNAIVVLDTYNPTADETDILYECVPSVLTTASGQAIINKNTSDSVILDDEIPDESELTTHCGCGCGCGCDKDDREDDTSYSTHYELILARPNNLFPVKYVDEMLKFSSKTYPDITLVQADTEQIRLAYQLYQMLLAYPTSNLASGFFQALTDARNNGESAEDIESIIANFLSSTKEYQSLDSGTYAAVMSYMQSYPNSFAAVATTYYLYSVPDTTEQKAAPVYEGMLVFVQKTPVPDVADPTDPNGGYQLHFYYPNGNTLDLDYDQGQCVSDTSQDFPDICLQGRFINKRHLTYSAEDNQIIPLWVGVINGVQVLGTSVKQETDSGEETEGSFYSFWHPTAFVSWLTLFSALFSLVFAVVIAVKGVRLLISRIQTATARLRETTNDDISTISEEETDQIREEVNDYEVPNILTKVNWTFNRTLPELPSPPPPDIPIEGHEYEELVDSTRLGMKIADSQTSLDFSGEALAWDYDNFGRLAQYGVTSDMEIATSDIIVARSNIRQVTDDMNAARENGDYDEMNKVFKEISVVLSKNEALARGSWRVIADRLEDIDEEISDDEKAQIQGNLESAQLLQDMAGESQESGDKNYEGDVDEDVDPIRPIE